MTTATCSTCPRRATAQTYSEAWDQRDPWNPAGFTLWCNLHAPAGSWPAVESKAADQPALQALDPIGLEDAVLVRRALLRYADRLAADLAEQPNEPYLTKWTNDLIRVRWLSGRTWNGATLLPNSGANDRETAMQELVTIAAEVGR
ncbi:hypothetical protein GUY44_06940 [Pimelobacter simplex]|uniref:Uncharacterized protein n=1 Tax=Nocardioides simplex TaxID=2045 RepID=A0A0A1DMF0_NOCSI|nr:hypothetical protein [Pimelobacter simplex]AIY17748.1 hypothetical protein KR76_15035 [Pimelobacter simplex]MCG8150207.1 hypothetical protein [Pimelobacter simplex]GEB13583.1 hypothetical protein NSI01_18980 [Pimelobacter simplex]SFM71389.1 hypothetical protein SAMN05421671_3088 [Pimelobacter simplex]